MGSPTHAAAAMKQRMQYIKARIKEVRKATFSGKQKLRSAPSTPPVAEGMPMLHWDTMMAELLWMQNDFINERKYKEKKAKALVRGVLQTLRRKEQGQQRLRTERKTKVVKKCRTMAKAVQSFWKKVDKIVQFKNQATVDATRKEAMDSRLEFIIKQTEMYASLLSSAKGTGFVSDAGTPREPEARGSTPGKKSVSSSSSGSGSSGSGSSGSGSSGSGSSLLSGVFEGTSDDGTEMEEEMLDGEFLPSDEDDVDDLSTLLQEEEETGRSMNNDDDKDEEKELAENAIMDLESLLPVGYLEERARQLSSGSSGSSSR